MVNLVSEVIPSKRSTKSKEEVGTLLAETHAGTLAIFQLTSQHWHGQPGAQVRRIDDRPRDAEHAPNTSTHIFIDTSMLDNIRIMQI